MIDCFSALNDYIVFTVKDKLSLVFSVFRIYEHIFSISKGNIIYISESKKKEFAMPENNSAKGIFVGFLVGGAIGAILALLYAPKGGKELRTDIREKTDEYLGEAEKYIAEAKDKIRDMINEGKRKPEKLFSDAEIKSEEFLKDAEKIFGEAKLNASGKIKISKENIENEGGRFKNAVKAGVNAYKSSQKV
jgi:gas vesicle protein